jgi:hypothetical protein
MAMLQDEQTGWLLGVKTLRCKDGDLICVQGHARRGDDHAEDCGQQQHSPSRPSTEQPIKQNFDYTPAKCYPIKQNLDSSVSNGCPIAHTSKAD